MRFLIEKLVDARDVFCQQKFDVGRTRQKLHITPKPNVEPKRQRLSKVALNLEEKLLKRLTLIKDTDIVREMGDNDNMGPLHANLIILMH